MEARQDTIERQITVSSPIEKVWEALTVAEHLAAWFGDSAEIDLRPGGAMRIGWSEYDVEASCVVQLVDPPTTFAYTWDVGRADDGAVWTTSVTFTLAADGDGTRVTVVESGLAALPAELYDRTLEENSSGWTAELEDLRMFLERAAVA